MNGVSGVTKIGHRLRYGNVASTFLENQRDAAQYRQSQSSRFAAPVAGAMGPGLRFAQTRLELLRDGVSGHADMTARRLEEEGQILDCVAQV